ncbi:MAG: LamG domain-containing protein [Armatimonadetes bacterium]|nr:LamG domain-containing protein [Armatimonadota bacterium]
MRKLSMMLIGLALLCSTAFAANSAKIEPREWTLNGQAMNQTYFTATFIKYEKPFVYLQMPDGFVRKVPAGQISDQGLWYIQSVIYQVPEKFSNPAIAPAQNLIVDISAKDLPLGPITQWANKGAAGGAFHALRTPLTVKEIAGKKAVNFYFGPWAVPLEFDAMVSDFIAPKSIIENGSYSVVAWVYSPSPLGIDSTRESVMSWHAIEGDSNGSDFGYGTAGRYAVETRGGSGAYSGPLGSYPFPEEIFPAMNVWHHIAWVYSPSEGKFNIYIDGKLAITKDVKGSGTSSGDKAMFLGCNFGGGRGGGMRPQSFFTGAIADLKVYSSALDESAILKLYGKPVSPTPVKPAEVKAESKDYFTPEFDGLVAEPFPKAIRQSGEYGKFMEGWGQPVIGRDRCPDEAMRRCAYTMAKTMRKRPDIVNVMQALDIAARLDDVGPPWLGFTEMTTACYGQARSFFADPGFYWGINIMVHEMGHQFHMWGCEQIEADFRDKLFNIFWQNKMDGLWSGDYGGLNMWEYMACAASAYCSDGTEDDAICRREQFRQNDPRMFYFLQQYWPGDLLIDLNVMVGLKTDAYGKIVSWENQGGLEFWGKFGLKKYPWSTGEFEPKGSPETATVGGVASVKFNGSDALAWNLRTRESLIKNHAWSVELWAYKNKDVSDNEALLSWGDAGNGARLIWGKGKIASDLGQGRTINWKNKPSTGAWHHIVFNFMGGGLEDGKGKYTLYVDGKADNSGEFKLDIPTDQQIIIGGALESGSVKQGFTGAIANVHVYDYDLGVLQLAKHYDEQKDYYKRERLAVAGTLMVDLDARCLAYNSKDLDQTRPLYPKSLNKNWLRSWANRGIYGGKLYNDAAEQQTSYPHVKVIDGVTAVSFGDEAQANEPNAHNDRMLSSFFAYNDQVNEDINIFKNISTGKKPKMNTPTFEMWVYRASNDNGGPIFRWGNLYATSEKLKPGRWQHVVYVFGDKTICLYIDGKYISEAKIDTTRSCVLLEFGSYMSSREKWTGSFKGAIAQVRIHSGALSAQQIKQNYTSSDLMLASHPSPAIDEKVVAGRAPALSWNPGVRTVSKNFDVYLSTDPAQVASAKKNGAAYAGKLKIGAYSPKLETGKTYFWRVDGVSANGKLSRGPVWSFKSYDGLLIDLDASKLANGKLEEWNNIGKSGGKFVAGSFGSLPAPQVETCEGRNGVSFFGNKYLTSTFKTPESLVGDKPFSVSLWVYNNNLLDKATMLSWGISSDKPIEFIYGRGTDTSALANGSVTVGYGGPVTRPEQGRYNAPMLTFWNNIVYTYSGGASGSLKIYVNGILNTEKSIGLQISDGGRISVGALVDELGNRQSAFAGFISDVAIFSYAVSKDEAASIYDGGGVKPDNTKMLVKLTCDTLPKGKLTNWKNQGTAGGEFTLLPENPTEPSVETVAGRKAVTFDGANTFMSSDINTPASVTGINPVTIEMWAYNPQIRGDETVFTLAPREAFKTNYLEYTINRSLEMCYSQGGDYSSAAVNTLWDPRNFGWKDKTPEPGKWHHIAFVYDGKKEGNARLYADGQLVSSRGFYTLCTNANMPMFLGTAWNTDRGTTDMFTGSLAGVKVYDYAKTDAEISKSAK